MAVFLDYIWQSTFCMLIFFGIYWIFLRNEKALNFTRIYLLISPLLALILPLVRIPVNFAKPDISLEQTQFYRALFLQEASDNIAATYGLPEVIVQSTKLPLLWGLVDYAFLAYLLIVFLLLFRLFWIFLQLRFLKEKGWYQATYNLKNNYFLIPTFGLAPFFSHFNKLFWDDTQNLGNEEREQILRHEIEHIRQGHSYDLLYYQILCTVFWFNPGIYLLRSALVDVHEFLADDQVLAKVSNKEIYPKLIVKMAFKGIDLPIGNYFVRSTTLKRILMMKNTAKVNWLKILMIIPMSLVLMGLVSMKTENGLGLIVSNITANLDEIHSQLISSQDSLDVNVKVKKFPNPVHYELIGKLENGQLQAQIGELLYEFSNIHSDEEYIKVRGLIKSLRNTSVHLKQYDNALKRYQVDEPARPKQGMEGWYGNFLKGIESPQKELELGLGGILEVEFVINETGEISQPVIKTSFGAGLDEKVLKAFEGISDIWLPAKKNGKPVAMINSISFAFYPEKPVAKTEAHEFFRSNAQRNQLQPKFYDDQEVFDVVENSPEFRGGFEAWNNYIRNNLSYPESARLNGIEGTVYLVFVINKDGKVENPEILRGVGFGLDQEALRVVSESPDWIPGYQKGQAVNVRMRLPVRFKLPEKEAGPQLSGMAQTSKNSNSSMEVQHGYNSEEPRPSLKGAVANWTVNTEHGVKFRQQSHNDVLFVIDGVALPDFNPEKDIKPNQIKSMEIVKGERALEMFPENAEKATNGVILINTKN
ncbi:M56 family metallopeptidase [Cecembia rubra]|uniref:TonB family protein n=1 Tax=Cecembia rubra TaxID=1485585 RepID=A0A2P8EDF1_9BACT|nr:M56 family metallopeptidase [Cecembia rubra]PSL07500.1 TonB family protein [Cecembia rubra]